MRTAAGITATTQSRRSDRQKRQQRQQKARKGIHAGGASGASLEEEEYRNAIRIDHLEECAHNDYDEPEQEDEYNEEDEIEPSRGKRAKRKRPPAKKNKATKDAASAKRLKPRSLSSILVEEARRNSNRAKCFVEAEALPGKVAYPVRKFCPVTGLFGIYKDPKSGVHFANLKALEQIQERLPPWLSHGGSASYSETIKSLRSSLSTSQNADASASTTK